MFFKFQTLRTWACGTLCANAGMGTQKTIPTPLLPSWHSSLATAYDHWLGGQGKLALSIKNKAASLELRASYGGVGIPCSQVPRRGYDTTLFQYDFHEGGSYGTRCAPRKLDLSCSGSPGGRDLLVLAGPDCGGAVGRACSRCTRLGLLFCRWVYRKIPS